MTGCFDEYLLFLVLSVLDLAVDEVSNSGKQGNKQDIEDVVGEIDQEIFNTIDEILETV